MPVLTYQKVPNYKLLTIAHVFLSPNTPTAQIVNIYILLSPTDPQLHYCILTFDIFQLTVGCPHRPKAPLLAVTNWHLPIDCWVPPTDPRLHYCILTFDIFQLTVGCPHLPPLVTSDWRYGGPATGPDTATLRDRDGPIQIGATDRTKYERKKVHLTLAIEKSIFLK